MFDFAGSEIVLIGIVALVLIGPKDLPIAVKGISTAIKKMRRMAGEFQTHVDEMVREADLGEVRDTLSSLRGLNVKNALRSAVDPDSSLRGAFSDPFAANPVKPVMTPLPPEAGALPEQAVEARPAATAITPVPAFIPPGAVAPDTPQPLRQAPPFFLPPRAPAPDGPEAEG